jgi:phosphate/sulfate permease
LLELFTIVGFILAGYSVIANDSVQTLGTWIASNRDKFKWTTLWAAASSVLVVTLVYGFYMEGGDISFGRLDKIPYKQPEWYHALAPLALVLLTRRGIPVSTSFLVLSAFASTFVLEKMLLKSVMGYGLAAVVAYVMWLVISRFVDEKEDVSKKTKKFWRVFQWLSTGFLWFTWLSHDVANIAVFLPRELTPLKLVMIIAFFVAGLGWIFYKQGGAIQQIVLDKQSTKYVRSATLIDLVYAFLLLYFKQLNNIPMSTTWVFVGLLCGRELALNTGLTKKGNLKSIFPIVAKDFLKLIVGLLVSVSIVLAIHYGTDQDGDGTLETPPIELPTQALAPVE